MADNPAKQLARMLDLIPYIYAHQGITKKELAEAFEISIPELQSDLLTLWKCGVPPYTPGDLLELEFEGDEVWVKDAEALRKPRGLQPGEIARLILGLQLISNESLSEEKREKIKRLIDRLSIENREPVIEISPGSTFLYQREVADAIATGASLEISYHSVTRDEVTKRTIAPFALTSGAYGEEVQAYCFTAQGYRTFRGERIRELKVIEKVDHSQATRSNSEVALLVNLKVKISSHLREVREKFVASQKIDWEKLVLPAVLDLEIYPGEWALRTAASLGGAIEVLEPASMRKDLARFAQKTLDRYESEQGLR